MVTAIYQDLYNGSKYSSVAKEYIPSALELWGTSNVNVNVTSLKINHQNTFIVEIVKRGTFNLSILFQRKNNLAWNFTVTGMNNSRANTITYDTTLN